MYHKRLELGWHRGIPAPMMGEGLFFYPYTHFITLKREIFKEGVFKKEINLMYIFVFLTKSIE